MKKFYFLILSVFLAVFVINAQTTHTINTGSFYYTPSTLTINVGDSVIWINDGGTHDVNGNTNSITNQPFNNPVTFDSPSTSSVGAVIFAYKFTVPGTYNYDCSVGSHAANGMVGTISVQGSSVSALTLTGIMDFTVPTGGSDGKAIQLTANQNISDLSIYSLNTFSNGSTNGGTAYTFPNISVNSGEHILLCRDSTDLSTYFGSCWSIFHHVIQGSQPTGNGDDATVLYMNNNAIETHGVVGVDGTGEPWEYLDSWAWKDTAASNVGNWVYGGVNCSDGSTTTQTSSCPFPLCTPISTDLVITTEVCGATDSNTVLRLTGPFWGWNPTGGPTALNNGDGTFTFTLSPAPTADMEYLFVLDGVQEDMVASGTASGNWSCTPVTDNSGYANRQWLMTDPLSVTGLVYGSCDPCPAPSTDLVITTEVCGATDSNTVLRLTGPFWGWNPTGGPTALNNGDGTFTFTLSPAPTADMEYLFVLDGVQEDMVASGTASGNWSCTPVTDNSGYANRQWLMTDPLSVTGLVYGSCDPCPGPPPPPGGTILGTWKLNSQSNAIGIGPNQGDISWWSIDINGGGPNSRPCQYDDSITFYADGTFDHFMDSLTWIESWQPGSPVEGCGFPIAPHNGGLNTYSYSNDELTVYGSGAHLGLAKVHNGGEDGMPVGDSIVYQVAFSGQNNEIATIDISFPNAGGVNGLGWWRFIYTKTVNNPAPPVSTDLVITTEVCGTTDSNTVLMLTGPFWGWNPTGGPTAVNNGDGTFTFTLSPAPSADMEYLFVLDGVQEDMVASGTASGNWGCTPVTNNSSYANRQWLMTDPLSVTGLVYGSCDPCSYVPPAAIYYAVTYSVNTANMSVPVGPNGIYVGGGFYGVGTSAMAFQLSDPDGDGIWTGTDSILSTTVGNYTLLNSPTNPSDWGAKEDLTGLPCADAANNNDRILPTINGDTTLLHCFGTCDTDGTCLPPLTPVNIAFQVDMSQSAYTGTPFLRGSWDWGGNGDLMTDANGDNIWDFQKSFTSAPGIVYEYLYSVDTGGTQGYDVTEQNDPLGPCTNGNSQYTNRVLSIPTLDTILGVVCFESCSACPIIANTLVVSECDDYFWSGNLYDSTGYYSDTLQTSLGVDSIVSLDLTIFDSYDSVITITACDLYDLNGIIYTTNSQITESLLTLNNCDSTTILNLIINQSTSNYTSISSCGSYLWSGDTINVSGIYIDTLLNTSNCLLIDTLDLTISTLGSAINVVECDSFVWNGVNYDSTGIYFNYNGTCTDTLYLSINNSSTGTDVQTACDSYTWINGITYTSSNNTATSILQTSNGCDSVVTLDLTIINGISLTIPVIACNSFIWDGVTYDSTGTYNNVYQGVNGCDSVVTLDLTINNGSTSTVSVTACDLFVWDGMTYDSTGIYTNIYQSVNGCDSIVTLDLMIYSVSASIDTTGGDLVASGGLSYLWNTGDTDSTITPDTNGLYTVVILDTNGCADTASYNVTYITSTDIWDNLSSSISLYPNPVNDILNISSSGNIKSLEIKDLLGRVIYSSSELNFNNISLNTSSFSNNVYMVSCIVNDQLIVKKIIISR